MSLRLHIMTLSPPPPENQKNLRPQKVHQNDSWRRHLDDFWSIGARDPFGTPPWSRAQETPRSHFCRLFTYKMNFRVHFHT